MIEFRYVLFHVLLLFLIYFLCNKYLRRTKNSYWKIAVLPILIFTIEEGLRYGREIDWCVYHNVYMDIANGIDTGHELLFTLIWKAFSVVNAPYYIVIACCSCFFIYSFFYLFKPHKEYLFLIIPICILYEADSATNLIRFFMGLSFLFIATRDFLDGKRTRAIIFSTCAVLTHIGLILLLPLVWLIITRKRIISKPFVTIAISILLIVFFDKSVLANFSFIFDIFQGVERFAHYRTEASLWITSNGGHAFEGRDMITNFVASIPLFVTVYYGYKIAKMDKEYIKFYNLLIIGLYLRYISLGLELLGRYTLYFYPFYSFYIGITLFFLLKTKKNIFSTISLILIIIFIGMKFYSFCAPPYNEDMLLRYVWDGQIDPSIFMKYYLERL